MAIKNTLLGGTDWESPARIKPVDLNDTFDRVNQRTKEVGFYIFNLFEQETLSVTDSDAYASYSEEMDNHIIQNIGANICYLNFDATATTSGWKLNPSESLLFNGKVTDIHAICDSTKTTTLRIIGQK